MGNIYKDFIKILPGDYLADILSINSLRLPGFRIKSPNNPIKTARMQNVLIEDPKLKERIHKTVAYYNDSNNKDYTWALITTINQEKLQKKIEMIGFEEVLFALFYGKHDDLLKSLISTKLDNAEENLTLKNESNHKNDDNDDIVNLRNIVKKMEIEKEKYMKRHIEVNNKAKNLEKENKELISKNKKIIEDNLIREREISSIKEFFQDEITKIENKNLNQIKILEQKIKELEQEKIYEIANKQKKVMVVGNKVYYNYLKQLYKETSFYYLYDINQINMQSEPEKIIILNFTFSKKENMEIQLKIEHVMDETKNKLDVFYVKNIQELSNIFKEGREML